MIKTRLGGKITVKKSTGEGWYKVLNSKNEEREWHISDFCYDQTGLDHLLSLLKENDCLCLNKEEVSKIRNSFPPNPSC